MRTDRELLDGLEAAARCGATPALINDDNGHWACVSEGMQSVVVGDQPVDVWTSFWIPARTWRPTAREAIEAYLVSRDNDEDDEDDALTTD